MRTANPALNDKTFARAWESGGEMTIMGTVGKTAILLVVALTTATWTWARYFEQGPASVSGLLLLGAIGGLIVALITIFKPTFAPIGAPLYAALEGLLLGAISAMYEQRFQGLPMQAAALTFFTLAALLLAYRSGLIRATENFKLGVVAATGAIMLFYVAAMVMGFFGVQMPLLHDSSPLGIALSAVIVVVAALNLVLDFDFIENGAERGAPKYMEWYAAFGLMVTLIWLYLEILRLLAKLRSR